MIIKQKSLVVALTSGCVISAVLVLTLIGYAFYLKIKDDNSRRVYEESISRINARAVSR